MVLDCITNITKENSSCYISTNTEEWAFDVFSRMTDTEFSKELTALCQTRNVYLSGDDDLVNSFVLEYMDSVYEIARDSLCVRFVDNQSKSDSLSDVLVIQEELDHRTRIENMAVKLIEQCKFEDAISLLATI